MLGRIAIKIAGRDIIAVTVQARELESQGFPVGGETMFSQSGTGIRLTGTVIVNRTHLIEDSTGYEGTRCAELLVVIETSVEEQVLREFVEKAPHGTWSMKTTFADVMSPDFELHPTPVAGEPYAVILDE